MKEKSVCKSFLKYQSDYQCTLRSTSDLITTSELVSESSLNGLGDLLKLQEPNSKFDLVFLSRLRSKRTMTNQSALTITIIINSMKFTIKNHQKGLFLITFNDFDLIRIK